MAQNIGLVITLGGVEKVISSIEELEGAINSAREQLRKTTVPGSEEFKKLANDIRIADSRLKDLKKSSEGLEFEQKLEGFAKLGGSITAGFAAATAAVNLFGGDTERVSQAAAQAQNVLTIALTARSVAEGVAGLRTVALTVKTLAQTAATTAATAATRAFYATLVANPLGAVLAVIGLIVTALVALTNTTEEAESAEEKYQKTLKKTNDEREFTLALLREQGATETEQIKIRIANATQDLNAARARLNVLKQERASQTEINKELQIIADSKKTITLEQARLDRIAREDLEKGEKELADNRKKRADERKGQIEAEIALQGELTRAEIARELAGQQLSEAEFNTQLEKRLDLVKSLTNSYKGEKTILQQLEDVFGDRQKILVADLNQTAALATQYNKLKQSLGFAGAEAKNLRTVLNEGVEFDITGAAIRKTTFELQRFNEKTGEWAKVNLDERLIKVGEVLTLIERGFKEVNSEVDRFDFATAIRAITDFSEKGIGRYDDFVQAQKDLKLLQEQFVAEYIRENLKLTENQVGYSKALEETTKNGELFFQLLVKNQTEIAKFESSISGAEKTIRDLDASIKKLVENPETLNAFLAQNRDLITQSFSVDLSKLEENRNALLALDRILATKQYSEAEGFRTEILELEKQLAEQGIDISKASDEEKLKLLRFYLGKEVEATEEAEVKKRTEFQKTLSTIENYISQFQGLLNSVSQLVADYYSIQLQELELQNKAILDQVVGDTEVANEKRLEQQKIYEAQREELEKEAAKRGLQIQLAQAVANTAQAITRVFAQEGTLGFITAGLVAAANAIQIGLISQQLSAVSSYQRGGWIKGQGGLVVGPSHEQGGVKYAQGGVELEGGEAVINRMSTLQYGSLLNSVNMAGGGKPIVVNNSFDDSRLLEALAKQKSEPIRAYVLEGDITAKQNVTKRLEQLSQF